MKNQENIEYTYKHRKIVKYLAEKYIQKKKKEKKKANRRTRHRQNIHVLNIRKKKYQEYTEKYQTPPKRKRKNRGRL